MPIYTYTCTACNDLIEKRQSFSDPPLTTCEQCGGALRKVIHPVGIVFKGSGWYITDSRSAPSSAHGRTSWSSSSEAESTGKSSDSPSAPKTTESTTSTSDSTKSSTPSSAPAKTD